MGTAAGYSERQQVSLLSLVPFLIITFGVAWGVLAMYVFGEEWATSTFGPITGSHPLFILAVYAPGIAGVSVVLWAGGLPGLTGYLSRLLLWRCASAWYAFLLIGIPLIFYAGSAVKGNLGDDLFPFESIGAFIGALAFMMVLGPVEEFGWRGVMQPVLQRYMVPFWAAMLVGLIWGLWHLPAFLLSGTPQSGWGFTPFLISSFALSIIVTGVFNGSRGSILLPALFHFQLNNPLWPDAQPYDTIFVLIAASGVVWFNRDMMFSGKGAVTEVIPGTSRHVPEGS